MNRRLLMLLGVASFAGLAACQDNTAATANADLDDSTITADVAQSSGDAIASSVSDMVVSENSAALPTSGPSPVEQNSDSVIYNRTRTCYDSTGTAMPGCTPVANIRTVAIHVQLDGTRTGPNFFGAVHRLRDDTVSRNYTGATEVSRTHNAVGTAKDTSNFDNGTRNRLFAENAQDSVEAITWTFPRINNPFPVSGTFVRNVAVHAEFHGPNRDETRDVTRRVEVDFPADGQGNVVLKINAKTCNLNLVTRAVTNCQ
ncbi:MAG TPA: hypothetical protein VGI92_10375 [Gemmatimonadales bacterium]|jgi:hypothetical protein